MTNQPAHDARPSTLHPRLTVALVGARDRERVADVLAGAGSAGAPGSLLRSADLWAAADELAAARAGDRRELRSRLEAAAARCVHDRDTAASRLDSLLGWRRTLAEGATWADELCEGLAGPQGAVEAARQALDDRLAEQKAAQQALDRVLEQRAAAAVAIEEADRELGDLSAMGMDETGLRRELEAAGRAVQDARAVHADAVAHLDALQLRQTALAERHGELLARAHQVPTVDPAAVLAVQDALVALRSFASLTEVDPKAQALADAWSDLSADLAHHLATATPPPSPAELAAARERVAQAAAALAALDAQVHQGALSDAARAELDAAHNEVLAAEERTGRRLGASGARARLDAARAREQELLERHGFATWLDVVLSGGRTGADDPRRLAAEREHLLAVQALEGMERTGAPSPELEYLESERTRLHSHIVELLGVDPGDAHVALLRRHPVVPNGVVHDLVTALADAGVHPVGTSAEDAAAAFLEAHAELLEDQVDFGAAERSRQAEAAEVEGALAALADEVAAARSEVDRTAEALQMAERSVSAFEGELTVRAGEDVARMKRFAAAEQLRAQVEAVSATLERAEAEAREALAAVGTVVAAAEGDYERATGALADLARRARKLAEELPIDQRPEGDPLATLPELASALRRHLEVLQPEIDAAEAAFEAAAAQAEEARAAVDMTATGDEGPQPDDLVDGLEAIFDDAPDGALLVLDEPFLDADDSTRRRLLEVVLSAVDGHQIALLTEDADVLGWAIELPAEVASALPADALLARIGQRPDGADGAAGAAANPADPAADPITADPAPPTRRWAGQR